MSPPSSQVAARYTSLLSVLGHEGRLDVAEAAGRLGVAPETIRRDLRALERGGKLHRVHGGAVPVDVGQPRLALPVPGPAPIAADTETSGGVQFSAALWQRLPRHGTVLLGTGPLITTLAQAMAADPPSQEGLAVVSTSLDAAVLLSRVPALSVYNAGGTVSARTHGQEGDWTLSELARFRVDVSVVAPEGITLDQGLAAASPAAAAVAEAVVNAGSRVIAVGAASTLGSAAFVTFAAIDRVNLVALTASPRPDVWQPFVERGVPVEVLS